MEFGLREVLIGVGLLVIAGILFDGFRRMRRSRNGSLDMHSEMGGSMDDDWGYYKGELPNGGARVIKLNRQEPEFDEADIAAEARREPDFSDDLSDEDLAASEPMYADTSDRVEKRARTVQRQVAEPDPFQDPEPQDTVQDYVNQSLAHEAPVQEPAEESVDRASDNYEEVQSDLFADDEMLERAKQEQERKLASHYRGNTEPRKSRPQKPVPKKPEPEPVEADIDLGMKEIADVLVVNVMAKPGNDIIGEDLYRAMASCGFRHGDMNIFHRFEQHNGGGRLLFSIANVVEPGTFEPEAPEGFTTPGICMFLKLPGPKRPLQAFEIMVESARKIGKLMNADMKDEHHSVMTQQTFEHYRQRVIDFERKQLSQKALTR